MKKQTTIILIILILLPTIPAQRYIIETETPPSPELQKAIISEISPSKQSRQIAGAKASLTKPNLYVIGGLTEEQLISLKEIKNIEPDYKVKALDFTNPPITPHLANNLTTPHEPFFITNSPLPVQPLSKTTPWNQEAIGINFSNLPQDFGQNIKIAVLDTGVNFALLDINQGYDFVNNDPDATDDNSHGTFTTQILKSPQALPLKASEIYAVKVLDNIGEGYVSDVIQGIYWAEDNNIDIVLMSFGGPDNSIYLQNAIDWAYDNNILFIASTGNTGDETISFPADYSSVISVGSINQDLKRSSFSNLNPEFVAPGENILVTDGVYDYLVSGTSFSTPHAGVAAAALLSQNPDKTNKEIRSLMQQTAIDLGTQGKDSEFGYGIPQATTQQAPEPNPELEEIESRVSALEIWKDTITETIADIWLSITGLITLTDNHEARITALESQAPITNNETFPEYLNYLSSSDRKKIICGYGENHRLNSTTALGYACTLEYKTYSSGRETVKCKCKKI